MMNNHNIFDKKFAGEDNIQYRQAVMPELYEGDPKPWRFENWDPEDVRMYCRGGIP